MTVVVSTARSCKLAALAISLFAVAGLLKAQAPVSLSAQGAAQLAALLEEKAGRTPTQQKIDAHLLYASKTARGISVARGMLTVPWALNGVSQDTSGRALVDIRATVTPELLAAIAGLGGEVVNSQPEYDAVRAWLPISQMEALAGRPEVHFIQRAARFHTNVRPLSQGDIAHGANLARSNFNVNGTGVKVGVLSDSADSFSISSLQSTGDLPAGVTVVPGQAGAGTNEGVAMMEIIYDLAPGAQLFFATGNGGEAQMAQNIRTLRNTYGCDIIVDDITYLDEAAFQDGTIAQAINSVVASGALFFSSAANSGNLDSGTSGTWEGDFVNSGMTIAAAESMPVHSFGTSNGNPVLGDALTSSTDFISLKWSDPLGNAVNDYDLFLMDASLTTVLDASFNRQSPGSGLDPIESLDCADQGPCTSRFPTGARIVVVLFSGSPRALRVDTDLGRLSIATSGTTFGHNAGASTVSTAATTAIGATGLFTSAARVESFSSDGPRKIFFHPDGSPITPGNFLFTTNGGATLNKPDLTAADCVQNRIFPVFCGTSAAAPHAAAIAALVKSANLSLSNTQILQALQSTALGIFSGARDAGVGVIMANDAVRSVASAVTVSISIASNPPGQPFTLTGNGCAPGSYTAPQTLSMTLGSSCSVSFQATVSLAAGTQLVFSNWADGPTPNPRTFTPTSVATLTANYATQYQLIVNVAPQNSGTLNIQPAGSNGFYNANTQITVTATASAGFQFGNYSGTLSSTGNPFQFAIAAPVTLTANFSAPPNLTIRKTHNGSFTQGQAGAVYSLLVSNSGPGPSSGPVTVTESLPAGLTLVSMVGQGWTCGATTCTRSDTLAAGASWPAITATVNVASNAPAQVINQASVTGGATASDPTTIAPLLPGLNIAKTHTGSFTQGQSGAQYSLLVSNSGPGPSSGPVSVIESIPAGLLLVSITGPGWTCGSAICNRSDALAAGSSYPAITVTVNVASNAPSQVVNQAILTGGITATDPTTITPAPGCSFSLNSLSAALNSTGTSTGGFLPSVPQSLTLTPSAGCTGSWTATSSDPSWLTISSGATGSGSAPATISFQALSNPHSSARTATITVAASGVSPAVFTVTEALSSKPLVNRQVLALYQQLLGREPDAGGFSFWTGQGAAGLGQMADSFLTSPEAQGSDFQAVTIYQGALGRLPSFAEYSSTLAGIRSNPQAAQQTFNTLLGTATNSLAVTVSMYINLLGRAPTTAEMNAGVNQPPYTLFQTLTANQEFRNNNTNPLYIQMLYSLILSRTPDPGGFNFWVGVANQGGSGIYFNSPATRITILGTGQPGEGFIGSSEFQGLFQ